MERFIFTIVIDGVGNDAKEAWTDAVEQFWNDPGSVPDPDRYTTEPFDEET